MNFFKFNQKFPTEVACIKHYIDIRYPQGATCNHCGSSAVYHRDDFPKVFQCASCNNSFSVFKGTIFEKSCTDLRKWYGELLWSFQALNFRNLPPCKQEVSSSLCQRILN